LSRSQSPPVSGAAAVAARIAFTLLDGTSPAVPEPSTSATTLAGSHEREGATASSREEGSPNRPAYRSHEAPPDKNGGEPLAQKEKTARSLA